MGMKDIVRRAMAPMTAAADRARLLEARKVEFQAMQLRGRAAFAAYYENGAYAKAKLDAGMIFTPESVAYLEREVENRRIAAEIKAANTKDIAPHAPAEHDTANTDGGSKLPGDGQRDGSGGRGSVSEIGGRLDSGESSQG